MKDTRKFDQKIFDLTAELGLFVFDHPEVLDRIPDNAHVFFEVAGEAEFNRYSRKLAQRQRQEEDGPVVFVRIKGLAPRQGSRLIDPVIEPITRRNRAPRKKSGRSPSKR